MGGAQASGHSYTRVQRSHPVPAPHPSRREETKVPVWPRVSRVATNKGPVSTRATLCSACGPEVPAHHQRGSIPVFIEKGRSLSTSREADTFTSEHAGKRSQFSSHTKRSG